MEQKKLQRTIKFTLGYLWRRCSWSHAGACVYRKKAAPLVTNEEVMALSLQQYQEFMRTAPVERVRPMHRW